MRSGSREAASPSSPQQHDERMLDRFLRARQLVRVVDRFGGRALQDLAVRAHHFARLLQPEVAHRAMRGYFAGMRRASTRTVTTDR
jgi:hypothetical protein